MPNNIIRQDYGTVGTDVQTQMLIAPVLAEMKADRQFAVGDQFIVDSVLYKITTAISVIGTPLVVDSNCEVSDTITQQINDITTGIRYKYFNVVIEQSFVSGTTYSFNREDFGLDDLNIKGFAMQTIQGNSGYDYGNQLFFSASSSAKIIYRPNVNNSTQCRFAGIVFYT